MRTVGIKPGMLEAVAIELNTGSVKRPHQGQSDIYPKLRCEKARRKTPNLANKYHLHKVWKINSLIHISRHHEHCTGNIIWNITL